MNGVGVGVGLTMLLHCDLVYVAERARLRAPFLSLGLVPEAGSTLLLAMWVGHQRAAEIFFTGEWVSAEQAVELGLAARALPEEELLPATLATAAAIAKQPLAALRETKRLLLATRADALRAARAREDAVQVTRIGSPENAAAIRQFLQERKGSGGRR